MTNLWTRYVPYHVARNLIDDADSPVIPREQHITAVTMFADVSGFTAMSEALGRFGKQGTEELTDTLNSYFDPTINLIERYGGIIGKFGGDAMTVLFPYTNEEEQRSAVRRAVACGLQVQVDMVKYTDIPTSGGLYSLAMKVGLGMGAVYLANVGDETIRLEFIIAGHAIDECSDAEHHSEKGDVVAADSMLPFIPEATLGDEREGFTLIKAFDAPVEEQPLTEIDDVPEYAVERLQRYIHPVTASRLQVARSDFIDEHRKTTVLFVNFSGFDYDNDPDISDKLQAYSEAVVRTVHLYGGYLNKIDMGDKGSKFIVLFGAPVAYEDDEERALRCALALSALPQVKSKIGVNSGYVFAGHVGGEARREYTVMGDVVNLSARLMQACPPGQVLVSDTTHDAAASVFEWEELDPIRVKGKSEPINIYRLDRVRVQASHIVVNTPYQLPMVGRKNELTQISERLENAKAGRGKIVTVIGDAGMGKTRLSAEVVKLALDAGFTGYQGSAPAFGSGGYGIWQGIWQGLLNIDPTTPADVQLEAARLALNAINPALLERLPLLEPVLDLRIPENDFTKTLEGELRQELLNSMLVELLKARADESPLLLILEDGHWSDESSRGMLLDVARGIAGLPVLLLILQRPFVHHEEDMLPPFGHALTLTLPPFSHDEMIDLINIKLQRTLAEAESLPDELVERITGLSGGNPFYIDELMNLIRDQGIDTSDAQALARIQLPDSLFSLILSRIDALSENEKIVLKVASVIGRIFRASWVPATYPETGELMQVLRQLNRLESLEFTPLSADQPEIEYLFKHALTQEVSYESITFNLRQQLHERVGEYIEGNYGDDINTFIFLLAYHYGSSINRVKQQEYFMLAADNARDKFLNDTALNYYERLLPLVEGITASRVQYEIGNIRRHTGMWAEAKDAYTQSLELAQTANDRARTAYAHAGLGDVLSYEQTPEDALPELQTAQTIFSEIGDDVGLNQVLKALGFLYLREGEFDLARATAQIQRQLAERTGNNVALSDATQTLGGADLMEGEFDSAITWINTAISAAESANYKQGIIYSLGNLSGVYANLGQFKESLASMEQALQQAEEIGYRRAAAAIQGNRGYIYDLAGDWTTAAALYEYGLDLSLDLGDFPNIQLNLGNIANARIEQGNYAEASELIDIAIELDGSLNMPLILCGYLIVKARILIALGQFDAVGEVIERAIDIAHENDDAAQLFEAQIERTRWRALSGQITPQAGATELTGLAEGLEEESPELGNVLYAIWEVNPTTASATRAADSQQALYEAMGMATYRKRYIAITGDSDALEAPAPLPPVNTANITGWRTLVETKLRPLMGS